MDGLEGGVKVAFARLASYFLLLSQKKETKEKATPCRLFPALLQKVGRCGTRYAQTVLAKIPQLFKSSQARQQGI